MLQLSQALINRPVMSLRTGGQVATTVSPIINPNNLKIEGLYCLDTFEKRQVILLCQDIRDIIRDGFVVNDHEVLTEPEELVRLKPILEINFGLIGKHVVTVSKERVGKVSDYATELDSMLIKKIYASQSLFKALGTGSLSIDRTNIVEITDRKIIINDLLQPTPAIQTANIPAN